MKITKVLPLSLLAALLAAPPLVAQAGTGPFTRLPAAPHLAAAVDVPAHLPGHFLKTDWDDDDSCPPADIGYLRSRLDSIIGRLNWRISHELDEGDLDWGDARYLRRQVWRLNREGHAALADGCVTTGERTRFRAHLHHITRQLANLAGEDTGFNYGW